ncbi:hypothetical protein [Calditerricola satsumensis]|uniref:Uncharacterized protein n=1 Tax=Calditerricola satsumensis TaxID=373054 RepID=A0A8J3FBQ2_9BACI|nr:hypothetical protein [Calditerricola satsumensis]GGK05742.1 hypothetical protein GCM10007043_19720 [Calditerricola satsumensis]
MLYEELLFLGPFLAVFLGLILLVLPAVWNGLARTAGRRFAAFAVVWVGVLLAALAFAVWVYLFVFFDVV